MAPVIDEMFGEGMSANVFSALDGIISFVQGEFIPFVSGIAEQVMPVVEHIMTKIGEAMPYIENIVSTAMDAVSAVFDTVWPAISAIVEDAVDNIVPIIWGLSDAIDVVRGIFDDVKTAIQDPMETAKNLVKGIIDAIKGFFNFTITWPHIPLPHFSISPPGWSVGDLLHGSIPSIGISWYATGGIVDGATLIGAGESGPEAIVPLTAPNLRPFAEAVAEAMGNRAGGIYIENMTVQANDVDEFAESVNRRLVVLGAM